MKAGKRMTRGLSEERLNEMIEEATVDCYNESEQITGFFTMIDENLRVPFEVSILGVAVVVERIVVERIDIDNDAIVAVCSRGRHRQRVPIIDLSLPDPPPKGAEWIEAYRRWIR